VRPWQDDAVLRRPALLVVAVVGFGAAGAGCGSSGPPPRPHCNAQIQILSPTPNAVISPTPTLRFNIIGGNVVSRTTGPLTCAEGHIHVSVDRQLVTMAFGTVQTLTTPLSPGPHALEAEYVATDHRPFANRVINDVLFQVKS
jgi:hypothetical protein